MQISYSKSVFLFLHTQQWDPLLPTGQVFPGPTTMTLPISPNPYAPTSGDPAYAPYPQALPMPTALIPPQTVGATGWQEGSFTGATTNSGLLGGNLGGGQVPVWPFSTQAMAVTAPAPGGVTENFALQRMSRLSHTCTRTPPPTWSRDRHALKSPKLGSLSASRKYASAAWMAGRMSCAHERRRVER